MSIIRISLLIMAIAVMLPSPPESRRQQAQAQVQPANTLVGSALESLVDLDPLCDKRGGVCTTAVYLIGRVEAKALYNIGLLYDWARSDHVGIGNSRLGNQANASDLAPRKVSGRSDNTLRLDDLIPKWRGPSKATNI